MQTAIVTGASHGLGRALALDLGAAGWHVVMDARGEPDLRAAANLVPPPGRVSVLPGDVTDHAHRLDLVAAAGGRLDLLALNASSLGQSPLPPLADYPLDAFREALEVNTVAQLALTQAALPALRASRGRIVAVTSDASVQAYPGWGGYGATKAALDHLARVLAVEEPDITVYSFDPGDLRTRMHAEAFPGEDISDRPEPESVLPALRRLVTGHLPADRYTAAYLAGSAAAAGAGADAGAGGTEPAAVGRGVAP